MAEEKVKLYETEISNGNLPYTIKKVAYRIPLTSNPSDVDLDIGDSLPDDSDYEIISYQTQIEDKLHGKIVVVYAKKYQVETCEIIKGSVRRLEIRPKRRYTVSLIRSASSTPYKNGDTYAQVFGSALNDDELAFEPVVVSSTRRYATANKVIEDVILEAYYKKA